jgi:hypothetical protein
MVTISNVLPDTVMTPPCCQYDNSRILADYPWDVADSLSFIDTARASTTEKLHPRIPVKAVTL